MTVTRRRRRLAAANYTLSGVVGSDDVALNDPTSGTYASANVGTGINVGVSGLALSGAAAGNYSLLGHDSQRQYRHDHRQGAERRSFTPARSARPMTATRPRRWRRRTTRCRGLSAATMSRSTAPLPAPTPAPMLAPASGSMSAAWRSTGRRPATTPSPAPPRAAMSAQSRHGR